MFSAYVWCSGNVFDEPTFQRILRRRIRWKVGSMLEQMMNFVLCIEGASHRFPPPLHVVFYGQPHFYS